MHWYKYISIWDVEKRDSSWIMVRMMNFDFHLYMQYACYDYISQYYYMNTILKPFRAFTVFFFSSILHSFQTVTGCVWHVSVINFHLPLLFFTHSLGAFASSKSPPHRYSRPRTNVRNENMFFVLSCCPSSHSLFSKFWHEWMKNVPLPKINIVYRISYRKIII